MVTYSIIQKSQLEETYRIDVVKELHEERGKSTTIQLGEMRNYLYEEELSLNTNGESGDKTTICPSCEMRGFVHAGGTCELDIWKELMF